MVLAAGVAAVRVAREVVTPPRKRPQDIDVLGISADGSAIRLARTPDTVVPGRYGLWFSNDSGYLRYGDILEQDAVSVTRRIEKVEFGRVAEARHGRLSGWYYLRPEDLELEVVSVDVPTDGGAAPAWLVPGGAGTDWAIHVHGRGTSRQETLRALPVFHERGYTSLVVSYRNDGDGPPSSDGRYGLGATEWRDVDAALRYALDRGARRIVLMGWSMGGAIVLQTMLRSRHADRVVGIVLESPVIDWVDTLEFQAAQLKLPSVVTRGALRLLDDPRAGRLTGQAAPVGLAQLDLVARADELTVPVLLMHSDDDGFVPADGSHALAAARGDIVTFVPFSVARHTKLWNYDPERWTSAISDWLAARSDAFRSSADEPGARGA
jgi:alpha-beta hydrolase superfamily lysophospholipase